ncbi:MAG: 2-hydroxyhepta-2,4-diene-1,7-dioate isomerase [Bacteroidetes bacterium]|nr:MAG: 2-hydroxyhepta-2,4-diene-1,7-dioate isomerase [Bacteroidota bacterium]PTM09480.1 MAG: 2-hydroxyhepta-2,4-diene-1,7-dioate isomerase [Bacteroidota bacterium]
MKIICIGRNYAEHARELNNDIPDQPVVFMKPASALLVGRKPFYYPEFTKDLHFETEIVLKIGKNGRHVQPEFALEYIEEISLGIDFTARDIQSQLKAKGQPWELAKAFDGSAVIGDFVSLDQLPGLSNIEFYLEKNGKQVQHGFSKDMLFSFADIICFVSQYFKLQMGDYIYTGTPAGVGPVQPGDELRGFLVLRSGAQEVLACDVR